MKSARIWIRLILFVLLIGTLWVAVHLYDRYFPYQPTRQEAVNYVLAADGKRINAPGILFTLVISDVVVTHVLSEIPKTQVVMSMYTQTKQEGDWIEEPARCFEFQYITRHWLSGPRSYSGLGGQCKSPSIQALLPPISMQGRREQGRYVVGGMVVDENIEMIRAHWRDGLVSTAPVISDAFLFFRADGVEVEWVEGLDEQGQVISGTLTHNRDVHFTPLDYTTFQRITLPAGVVILGAYTLSGLQSQECLEVTYLTAENAARFLQGKETLTGQRACVVDSGAEVLASIVSTIVAGDKVVSGRVLDERVTAVSLRWSDGWTEMVPVLDGRFFFAQRPLPPGVSIGTEMIRPLDAAGNEVTR
jgi:hypothetical protein